MARQVRALVTIVDYTLGTSVIDYYKEKKTTFGFTTHGYGTASSDILNYVGLAETKKSVTLTILEKSNAEYALWELNKRMNLSKPGKGIAFTIPVSSMNKFFVNMMEDYNDINVSEKEKEKNRLALKNEIKKIEGKEDSMNNDYPYELIFTIVNRDHLEIAKDAAKRAGARGGTSIHALGLGSTDAINFLGITINPEKEIMLNVVKKEEKNKIMSAIVEEVGIATAGQGICFALPVDYALGLTTMAAETNE
ncbi:MAG: P-II family nitrogen regulator [Clostridia bacterium]|nr:P-II family nitrogen regulator [Clostridia bacterium]